MSTITQTQIGAAMDEWLTTTGLTVSETAMIKTLKVAIGKGVDEFYQCAAGLASMMPAIIRPAVIKARTQGKCKEWPNV